MNDKPAPYHVQLVYQNYTRQEQSITPPKFLLVSGIPSMRLTKPNGDILGINLNFVHRFEYNTTNKEGACKTNGSNEESNH